MKKEILRMERVSYQEQDTMALDALSLNVYEGEILGLVPVNSIGIEALTRVLCYNRPLHYGYVYYNERLVNTWRHDSQIPSQIVLIQNQSSLVPNLTVLENVLVLGNHYRKIFLHKRFLKDEFRALNEKLGICIDPDAYADNLTVYERVTAELMKAVYLRSSLVVMWDVSTFVSYTELKKLHKLMEVCTREGMSFLYITPHIEETKELCQRTLCMYNGQIITSFGENRSWPQFLPFYGNRKYLELVRSQLDRPEFINKSDDIVFEMKQVNSNALHSLNLYVKKGECLVLQDMDGRIHDELLQILEGRCRCEGQILAGGKSYTPGRDVAIIQEFGTSSMLFEQMSYMDNLCFTLDHRIPKIWRSSRMRRGIRRDLEPVLGEGVFEKSISELTEQEKTALLYTRILMQHPQIVFCVRPFKGAEMEVRMQICQQVVKMLEAGIAVVIMAVNMADSLALADRVLQVRRGQELRQYLPQEFSNLPKSTPWRSLYVNLGPSDIENNQQNEQHM